MANEGVPTGRRFSVLQRDGFACRYCGATSEDRTQLHVDHVLALKHGGTDDLDNLVTACWACNSGKRTRTLHEACEICGTSIPTVGRLPYPVFSRQRGRTDQMLVCNLCVVDALHRLYSTAIEEGWLGERRDWSYGA